MIMNWLTELFTQQTFIQAVMVLSCICAAGLALGRIKIFGVSLGVTFVFFAGIIGGHFGLRINPEMLAILQNFGLILYIYIRSECRSDPVSSHHSRKEESASTSWRPG